MSTQTKPRDELTLLGLKKNADWQEIQSAYRRLALSLHPDVQAEGDATERAEDFRRITEAYETLRRRHLDARLRSRDHLDQIRSHEAALELPLEELELRIRHSSSPQLRAASALLLGEHPGKRSREILLIASGDADGQVRTAAIESLSKVGTKWDVVRSTAKDKLMKLGEVQKK